MLYFFSKDLVNYIDITPIVLKELPLPFVNNLKHLGNILQSDNKIFISKIHSLNQEFYITIQILF